MAKGGPASIQTCHCGLLLREKTCQSTSWASESSSGAIDDVQTHEHADQHATAHALTSSLPKDLGLLSSRGLPTPVVTVGRARERRRSNYPILGWALVSAHPIMAKAPKKAVKSGVRLLVCFIGE